MAGGSSQVKRDTSTITDSGRGKVSDGIRDTEGERQGSGQVMAKGQGRHWTANDVPGLVTREKRQVQPRGEEQTAVNRPSSGTASKWGLHVGMVDYVVR